MKKMIQLSLSIVATTLSTHVMAANAVDPNPNEDWSEVTIDINGANQKDPFCGCGIKEALPSLYFVFLVQPKGRGEEISSLEEATQESNGAFIKDIRYSHKNGYPTKVEFKINATQFQEYWEPAVGFPPNGVVQMVYPNVKKTNCLSPGSVEVVDNYGKVPEAPQAIQITCKVS